MRVSKLKLVALIAMSVFGLWASTSVLVIFYTLNQQLPICPSGTFFGIHFDCSAVLTSPYSVAFGIPLEILALAYFAVNLGMVYLIAFGSERASRITLQALFGWRFIGVAIVPYLVFVELFLIRAICVYCTIMHVAILVDFVVISYILFFGRHSLWAEDEEMFLDERSLESNPQNDR
ncbi:MAG TPA: vitamin K epoxide reductase family protein [Nitrososphaerales archaeon]|nr:vitamin K epoxide reductase family protein [Nitrososphaerales archaeon]